MDPLETDTRESVPQSVEVDDATKEDPDDECSTGTENTDVAAGASSTISTESNEKSASAVAVIPLDPAGTDAVPPPSVSPEARSVDSDGAVDAVASMELDPDSWRPSTSSPLAVSEPSYSLLCLPIDSLHSIASFLTPSDWSSLCLTGHPAHRVCREIVRRVRMHGFRCATEVVTAWKMGEHADARELSALYIKSGVPIYPHSLGHSYHTLVWRMGIETKEMENPSAESSTNETEDETTPDVNSVIKSRGTLSVDDFYLGRFPASGERFTDVNGPALSYLEEKCVFWYTREVGSDDLNRSGDSQLHRPHPPKITVKVHRHLADQHLLGMHKVDDESGLMRTSPVSLSADFFHPHFGPRMPPAVAAVAPIDDKYAQSRVPDSHFDYEVDAGPSYQSRPPFAGEAFVMGGGVDGEPATAVPLQPISLPGVLETNSTRGGTAPVSLPTLDENVTSGTESDVASREKSILTNVQLETYSSPSSKNTKSDQKDATGLIRSELQSRFEVYQSRVESLLTSSDNNGVDECLLDFWDEFLPLTKNIHFYDTHTAVPRMTGLESFLSNPCPKAVGVIQCEIERIKVSSKKKGVSMKGRLFPTYEYRLFIRDRRSSVGESAVDEDVEPSRRDTVLTMAKNRGRNHPGGYPVSSSAKKGVNNYYLYMPQQADIDAHFDSVNPSSEGSDIRGITSPAESLSQPPLLGRLQSNFTGTEFQIYTPTTVKKSPAPGPARSNIEVSSDGDNDLDYDSGVSSDNTPSRRRSGRRLRLSSSRLVSRGNTELIDEMPQVIEETPRRNRRKSMRRARSLPVIPYGSRGSWTSRRAIAHSVDPPAAEESQEVLCEEENGAITYTANLLGNRPRIMDVCIPKVTPDGSAGVVWRKYLESNADPSDVTSGNKMLQHFRLLQQRQENNDTTNADNLGDGSNDGSAVGDNDDFGLLPLQNRPPWWNVELGAFVLNFGGRVSVASVKNFQLCHRNDQDYIMLQFGRTQGRHSFTMDFQYPLTAVQAFAIAISSLQSKISFG